MKIQFKMSKQDDTMADAILVETGVVGPFLSGSDDLHMRRIEEKAKIKGIF